MTPQRRSSSRCRITWPAKKTISLTYDSDIEVVTFELQKLQFPSSGQLLLNWPDKLRVFDGKTFTVNDRDHNAFAQSESSSTIDQLVDKLRDEYFVEVPGADLLLSHPYDVLIESVIDAKHIGPQSGHRLAALG
jgi:hypothetical protein